MSADNAIAVWEDEGTWKVSEISMSPFEEDCLFLKDHPGEHFPLREKALVAAHDMAKNAAILEYGIIEESIPDSPCGMCYVCINHRNIVSESATRCQKCGEIITLGDYMVYNSEGLFHRNCAEFPNG